MKIKPGASVRGLRPEMVLALLAAEVIYAEANADCVLTEGTGGKHGTGSLHYVGLAVDLRTRDLAPAQVPEVVAALKESLGPEYDVVNEQDHIHIEFQPK